jgi:DtxR family Mn-dependent transcriptional regulator
MVSTNSLAASLQARPASVTDMLKKLKKEKLLHYEPYLGFRLNQEGKKVALQIIRKHRLWEYFLVKKLHFGWDEVHEMAEELEHLTSTRLIDRLDRFLEFPQMDPHGDPIPDANGKLSQLKQTSLLNLPFNRAFTVSGVSGQSQEMLEWLGQKNIRIGTRLEVRNKLPFDNSVEIKIKNQLPVTLSEQVAKNILVHE